jgi:hypothetical protein
MSDIFARSQAPQSTKLELGRQQNVSDGVTNPIRHELREKRRVDKRSASTYTEIVMVGTLRLSTLQQSLLTLNLTAVTRCEGMQSKRAAR